MTGARARGAAVAVLALLVAAGAVVAVVRSKDPPFAGAVAVLLEDNTLLTLDARGRVVWRARLGGSPAEPVSGRYLALAAPRELRSIVPGDRADRLAFVTLGDGVRRRLPLVAGVRFRAIDVGPEGGRIYLAGERATRLRSAFDGFAHAVVLSLRSPEGAAIASATLRRPASEHSRSGPLDWRVYDLAVGPGERSLVVSYHGPNTGGADRVAVQGGRVVRCTPRALEEPCIERIHGTIEPYESGFLAALGTPPLLGRFTREGRHVRSVPSGFGDAHLMEFAREGRRVFTVEACAKTGGMTRVELESGQAAVLAAQGPVAALRGVQEERAICGERISIGRRSLIAVMKRGTITGISGVLLVDERGAVTAWVPLDPAPVDVLVLP